MKLFGKLRKWMKRFKINLSVDNSWNTKDYQINDNINRLDKNSSIEI